jgi:hypothetical protein
MMRPTKGRYMKLLAVIAAAALFVAIYVQSRPALEPPKPVVWKGVSNFWHFFGGAPASNDPAFWISEARRIGSKDAIVDLTLSVAGEDGNCWLQFPADGLGPIGTSHIGSASDVDDPERYLAAFDGAEMKALLSIQTADADVGEVIGIVLARYGGHPSVIGVNVDMEFKATGEYQHVSDEERDAWLGQLKAYNSTNKLFLTGYFDYTYYPSDAEDIVVMDDGQWGTQAEILESYGELAKHFGMVGLYTGFDTAVPPVASDEAVLAAAPNTRYIIYIGQTSGIAS